MTDALCRRLGQLLLSLLCTSALGAEYGDWHYEVPPGWRETLRGTDRLVYEPEPGYPTAGAVLTLEPGLPLAGSPAQALEARWRELIGTSQVARMMADEPMEWNEALQGRRRSGYLAGPEGEVFVALDAYPVGERMYFVTALGKDEMGEMLVSTAVFTLGLSMAISATAADGAADPGGSLPPDPVPVQESLVEQMVARAPAGRLTTTADFDEIEMPGALAAFLQQNRPIVGSVDARTTTAADALAVARSLVDEVMSTAHRQRLAGHPPYADRTVLINDSAVLLVQGLVAESLARLLLAAERWPEDPTVRFNLASTLGNLGYANESLALLDGLQSAGHFPAQAFGIGGAAFLDYARAASLMVLGDTVAAERLLAGVFAEHPGFGEAALALALAESANGKDAQRAFVAGYFRRPSAATIATPASGQGTGESGGAAAPGNANPVAAAPESGRVENQLLQLDAVHFVDVAKGERGVLPAIHQPEGISSQIDYRRTVLAMWPGEQARLVALTRVRNRLARAWPKGDLTAQQLRRYREISNRWSESGAPVEEIAQLLRLRNKAVKSATETDDLIEKYYERQFLEISRRFVKDDAKFCAALINLVDEVSARQRKDVQLVDFRERRLHAAWHQYATALGSLVTDPGFRAYLNAELQLANMTWYNSLLTNMLESTHYAEAVVDCARPPPSDAAIQPGGDSAQVARCDDADSQSGVSTTVGAVSVSVGCDGIQVVLNADLGPLELTADVQLDESGKLKSVTSSGEVDVGVVKVSGGSSTDSTGTVTQRTAGGGVDLGVVAVSGERTEDGQGNFRKASGGVSGGVGPVKLSARGSANSKGDVSLYAGSKLGGSGSGAGATVAAEVSGGVTLSGNVSRGSVDSVAFQSGASASLSAGGASVTAQTSSTFVVVTAPTLQRGSQ
ncbi:MAG: hypothetical protein R3E82_10425 [Pseudomonadales bacterium]|nr:hypothetical protein [Pseudomonadales bacterium]